MSLIASTCLAVSAAALAVQWLSSGLAIYRCRRGAEQPRKPLDAPAVTIVRPLRGVEEFSRETLASTFGISYPLYEILFCVADPNDPVIPLVRDLIAEHPERDARLLIGDDALSMNPKLNNMAKGFNQAQFEHIVFVDSNVFMPAHYLDQLVSILQSGAGMVTAPPIGQLPIGFWAKVECAFLNTYQGRVQYAVDALGFGFAQGKTLFFRKADLDRGGFGFLASEPAEDAAATKMMRQKGKPIRLAGPFAQLIGKRTFAETWGRQLRWARLRRASFPLLFALEIMAGIFPPLLALAVGLGAYDTLSAAAIVAFVAIWYAPELALSRAAGWSGALLAMIIRDMLLPALYISAYSGRQINWHGKVMPVRQAPRLQSSMRLLTLIRRNR
jgi:ceramide glucosyltransferase